MLRIKTAVNAGLAVLYFLSAWFLNKKKVDVVTKQIV